MIDKEFERWLRNLKKLKDKWQKYEKKNKHVARKYKSKYRWFLKRIVRLVECDCVRYE